MTRGGSGFFDGFCAGTVKLACTMPLDTIKVAMQLKKTTDSDYRSITSSARTIVRCHGARALYTGLSAALLNQGGKTGVQFAAYSWWHATLEKACGGSPLTLAGCAGAMAGVTEAAAWTTPIDRVKTLRQAALVEANAAGTLHVRSHWSLVTNEMPFGLWRGIQPTVARQASGLAVRFLTYDYATRQLMTYSQGSKRPWHSILAGALCGAASAAANNPVDVLKSRIQAQASGSANADQGSLFSYALRMLRDEGPGVFFHGMLPRFLKIAAGQAIVFGVYDNLRPLPSRIDEVKIHGL